MKRIISVLLALLMLLMCFASCADQGESESNSDKDISDEASTAEGFDGEPKETIVSIGKPYTTNYEAGEDYPDTYGTELCDGIRVAGVVSYTDAKLSGWNTAKGRLDVVFDMGEDNHRLYKFGVSYYATQNLGIGPLSSGTVYVSDDGVKWTSVKGFVVPEYEDETMQEAWAVLDAPVDARYVRFNLNAHTPWLFLDELTVIADVSGSVFHSQYLDELSAAYDNFSASDIKAASADVSRDLDSVNAAIGCTYTTSRAPSALFPDDGNLLTDGGEIGASYENGAYVGFDGGEELTIDVDLGKTVEGLSDFTVSMYQQSGLRQMLPYYVDFYISEDGKTYEQIGRVYATDDLSITNYTYGLHLAKGYKAKAVRFVLAETKSSLFLIEEIGACYHGTAVSNHLYAPLELPEVTETLYWPNPSSQVTNLAAGLDYQIVSGNKLEYSSEIDGNTLASAGVLTDGKYSPTLSFDNGYWNRTRNGGNRNIYFDLGYNSSITGFKVNYLHYQPYAIIAPAVTYFYVSEDGVTWYSAGFAASEIKSETEKVPVELTLDAPVEARFVRVCFSVAPHCYVDEIEIYGSQAITSDTLKLEELSVYPAIAGEFQKPREDVIEGVTDLALLYCTQIVWDLDYTLPYVAYLDEEGNIVDTMFDGLLYLHNYGTPDMTPVELWLYQIDLLFQDDLYFGAADKAVAMAKEALNLPSDYKVAVFPTLIPPDKTVTDAGDIDGDGIGENFTLMEDRVKAISVYMDLYLDRFEKAGYENLCWGGFYWFNESIAYLDDFDDATFLSLIAKEADAKGTQICWIPYYAATGYDNWNTYGFSTACMQPNYVFNQTTPLSQLYKAVDYIKTYGMGIEIEVEDVCLSQEEFYSRYMRYLGYGVEQGYMKDTVHMYYQGHEVLYQACHGKTEMARNIYDATYGFIKGILTPPENCNDFSVSCEAGKYVQGNLLEDMSGPNKAELTLSAEHGSVTVDENGNYLYIPYEGFTGSDTFSFRYSNYMNWSEETTVTVQVG